MSQYDPAVCRSSFAVLKVQMQPLCRETALFAGFFQHRLAPDMNWGSNLLIWSQLYYHQDFPALNPKPVYPNLSNYNETKKACIAKHMIKKSQTFWTSVYIFQKPHFLAVLCELFCCLFHYPLLTFYLTLYKMLQCFCHHPAGQWSVSAACNSLNNHLLCQLPFWPAFPL